MFRSAGTKLPEELLQAIVVRLDDSLFGWRYERVPKHGLTPCSLTCRYWARAVRPLLFARLTLRSREDEAQLHAFLAAPDILGHRHSIGNRMIALTLSYDGAASGIPWTVLRPPQSAIPSHVEVRVEWRMVGVKGGSTQKWGTYLLSRVLPRIPPPSAIHRIHLLTLCDLAIPIRDFVRFIRFLRFDRLDMENVTFNEGEDSALLQALPALLLGYSGASSPNECYIHFRGCSKSALLSWVTVGGLVLSGQRMRMNDRRLQATISRHLSLCADIYEPGHGTYNLAITSAEATEESQVSRSWHYQLYDGPGILALISAEALDTRTVHVGSTQFRCPDLQDSPRGFAAIDQLCVVLGDTETAVTGRLGCVYNSAEDEHTLICGVLEERLLADPRVSRVLLQTGFWTSSGHAVRDIKEVPADVVLPDGTTLPLTTMQRTRWLYCDDNWARVQYLTELRRAADESVKGTGAEV